MKVPGSSGPNGTPGGGVPASMRYRGDTPLRERAVAFAELPTTLLDRVRGLSVLVGIVVLTISAVDAPGRPVPTWPHVVIGVVALASLGLWMIATYRRPDELRVEEALPPMAFVIAAVALRDPSAVIAPLLAVLFHRVLNDTRSAAILHSGLYAAAYAVAALLVGGVPRLLTLGSVSLVVGVVFTALIGEALRDVLQRVEWLRGREAELNAELSGREELFRGVVENSSDVIAILDHGGSLRFVSPLAEQVLGYAPQDILGRPVEGLVHEEELEQVGSVLEAVERGDRPDGVFTCRLRHRDGGWRVAELSIGPGDRDGGSVVVIRDVTHRKRLEDEIRFRAFHDPLTGLANRALFTDRLEQALYRAERNRTCVGVAFIDLDDFKAVNDNLGHAAGDELLVRIAGQIQKRVCTTDTAARLGGDEFALLLEGISDAGEAVAVVRHAMEVLQRRIHVAGNDLPVNASIGIAVSDPGSAGDGAELMRNADIAMYEAKSAGKNRYAVFEPDMHVEALEHFQLRADLALAVDGDEFVVNYQPIVDLTDRSVVGAEALVRWMHPTRGLIRPSDFIPLAEASGLTVPIGRWVIETACRAAAEWQRVLPAERRAYVSVNLSARQLHRAELVDEVLSALTDSGLEPTLLVLEVTETALTDDPERATASLARLRELGVRIAIDDFGTGYSSFRYLQLFPVDILKVDRSFVSRITDGPEEAALAHAIVKLAQSLGFDTIAEGIERRGEESTLRDWNCRYAQGYLYAPPLPHDVARQWITSPQLPTAAEIALPAPHGLVISG